MRYPAKFQPEPEGGYTVTFRDIPEAITHGETIEEARDMAADALLTSMDFYFDDRRAVPAPSQAQPGEELVALPLSAWSKVLLLNEMVVQGVRASDLARRLEASPQTVNRLINLHHVTKIDEVVRALGALGKRLDVRLGAA
jgi:antitoxin HicB